MKVTTYRENKFDFCKMAGYRYRIVIEVDDHGKNATIFGGFLPTHESFDFKLVGRFLTIFDSLAEELKNVFGEHE